MSKPFFAACAALLLVAMLAGVALAAPVIAFTETEQTAPEVKEGETIVAKFPFKNTGDQNLIIDQVVPSCGCTASKFSKVTKPGETGEVVMEIDTTGINGSFRKTAAVSTNDPQHPVITLVVVGQTQGLVVVEGGRRLTLEGCLGQEIKASTTIHGPGGKPVLITSLENPLQDYVDANLEPLGKGEYRITLTSKATKPINFAGPIFLHVPGVGKVSIWVVADILGAVKIRPMEVFFGTVTAGMGDAAKRSILLEKACTETIDYQGSTYDAQKFTLTENWRKPGEELLLVLVPNVENLPKGAFEEYISVKVGNELWRIKLTGTIYK